MSEIDISVCFSELAKIESWVKPKIDASLDFEIVGGRHPVVEHALKKEGKAFISNECNLSDGKICLLTIKDVRKSTFLRQNALIVLLAQISSSFLPLQPK